MQLREKGLFAGTTPPGRVGDRQIPALQRNCKSPGLPLRRSSTILSFFWSILVTIRKTLARVALATAGAVFATSAMAADISGAGATFPYPIYAKWADAYKKETGIGLNYQSIGSGGGIKQIKAKTVTFGASDKPLKPEELDAMGAIQWPMVMGGVVPVVNIPGIKPGEMKLDGATLADIYLGKITKWNDAAIAKLNPGVKLPKMAIAVAHRSDGSGTTFNFTYYLADVSPAWKSDVGVEASVEWPVGIGGKGNEGVAATVTQTQGSIGYVEYAYALQNKMTYTDMVNKDGKTVAPSSDTFAAAAANADWSNTKNFYLILANQPGADSWPMTAATFIIMYKKPESAADSMTALKFFDWAYKNGQKMAGELDYVPMPTSVIELVEKSWMDNIKEGGKSIWN
ncbi:phosphate ABC transporter substrate-binding protein PstS [Solimonas sp. C16B3]|uniref:Phosphate-binding protein PstS n=1 Tax=Solimonas marina TaxID=2714601 RepID=A0A969W8B4_9GAMM|nr:phosphate ABC transporter substrate-binding protein PstS [Solimonas marina]